MKVLALDPGAKRLGWAVLYTKADGSPGYVNSGIWSCEREDGEAYQAYRLRAMKEVSVWANQMVIRFPTPINVVSEILPVKGFNDMGQAYLALSVVSAITGIYMSHGYKVSQIGATTVKARIGGTAKASKVRVRNGVWQLLPELQSKASEWKKVYDESDAIAIALTHLGYQRPK